MHTTIVMMIGNRILSSLETGRSCSILILRSFSVVSSFMIGVTAFSGAITYFFAGVFTDSAVSPLLTGAGLDSLLPCAACLAFGAFCGSLTGARLARRIPSSHLRKYFSVVLFVMAVLVLLQTGGVI